MREQILQELLSLPFFTQANRDFAKKLDSWAKKNLLQGEDLNKAGHMLPAGAEAADNLCRSHVTNLGKAGFLSHSAVGAGTEKLSVRDLCLTREILSYHDGLADFAFAMQGLGAGPISLFGNAQQQETWLSKSRSGKAIAAFALSEPESGSDVANISTSATIKGDDFILNGEKIWISNGGIADFYTVFARTGEGEGAKGLSCFIVPQAAKGLEIAERLETIAPHPLARLSFNDCRIPASNLIGVRGKGFRIAMSVLDVFRSTVGAAALGFARRAFTAAIERAQSRELFGAPLAELQLVQAMLADMATQIDAMTMLIYRAAWKKDMGAERISLEASMAKYAATEAASKVIDMAVQIHGGDGVRRGHIVESLYREIRALRIYEGASEVQKVIIARQVLAIAEKAKTSNIGS